MTTQTTLSDAELIVKGYNAILEDAQYEEDIQFEEILLQLEDLDDEFETYREFELRLEAYENGAFDPDIEKILGIGGRKAGTWNPLSDQAGINREDSRREKDRRRDLIRTDNTARGEAVTESKKPGLSRIDETQFKGRQPGGESKGRTRQQRYKTDSTGKEDKSKSIQGDKYDVKTGEKRTQYKGGDLSDQDNIKGAIARKVLSGRKKLGAAKDKVDQRENIGRKIGETKDRVTAKVEDTAAAGKGKVQEGGSRVASGIQEGKRRVSTASDLISGGVRSGSNVITSGKVKPRIYDPPKPIDKKKADRPADAPKPPVLSENKPKPKWGQEGFASARGDWASKSFTDRLRKSMGYRPRRRYDDRLPW